VNQLIRLQRTVSIVLLIVCLAVIVPFEIFNEMQSLNVNPAGHAVSQIRMIDFFDLGNVKEQSTEAMVVSYVTAPADYGIGLTRIASFIRYKAPVLDSNIKNYSRLCLVLVSILCFFIFYQSSRTTSEADPLYG
jgi:hypothetical protein